MPIKKLNTFETLCLLPVRSQIHSMLLPGANFKHLKMGLYDVHFSSSSKVWNVVIWNLHSSQRWRHCNMQYIYSISGQIYWMLSYLYMSECELCRVRNELDVDEKVAGNAELEFCVAQHPVSIHVLFAQPFLHLPNNSCQIHSPWMGDKVDSGIGLSYRPATASLSSLADRYDKPYAGVNFLPPVRD